MKQFRQVLKGILMFGMLPIFVVYILQLYSCKDDIAWTDDNVWTISGHLYTDCGLEPVKNFKIQLVVNHPNGGNMSDLDMVVETTTDSTGYFSFDFINKRDYPLVIRHAAGAGYNNLMSDIPAKLSLDDLHVFTNPTTNIQINLNVINPHSANDTLLIADLRNNNYLSILGPFSSGKVYTANNFPLFEQVYTGENRAVTWYFNNYLGIPKEKWFKIDKFCNDTVFVSVDIN